MRLFYKRHQVNVSRHFSLVFQVGGTGSWGYFCLLRYVVGVQRGANFFFLLRVRIWQCNLTSVLLVQLLLLSLLVWLVCICLRYSAVMVKEAGSLMVGQAPWSASPSSRPVLTELFWLHTLSVQKFWEYPPYMFVYKLYTSTTVLILCML